ncbi:hypothetical protein ACUN9Y_19775 [Halomonas sp. V046]|uniref:hypothetical protein n=1 Tax=Halomonas sp. V046 TaxID=3459611 RepID=UPI004044351D
MSFVTQVAGIPCRCEVTFYSRPAPMRVTGSGFGDAEPPEAGEFEYRILDRRGRHAPWLEEKLVEADHDRLLEESLTLQNRAA